MDLFPAFFSAMAGKENELSTLRAESEEEKLGLEDELHEMLSQVQDLEEQLRCVFFFDIPYFAIIWGALSLVGGWLVGQYFKR